MSSGNLTARDRKVLTHLSRFGISYIEIIQHLFFGEVSPADVLARLRGPDEKAWCVDSVHVGPGNRHEYRITRTGAALIGRNGKSGGSLATIKRRRILAFCCLCGTKRIPLDKEELKELFADVPIPDGTHVLEVRGRGTRLFHVYVPSERAAVRKVVQTAKAKRDALLANEACRPWVDGRLYTVVIIVEEDGRAERIRKALHNTTDAQGIPLGRNKAVIVERVPAIGKSIEEALNALAVVAETQAG